MELMMKYNKV